MTWRKNNFDWRNYSLWVFIVPLAIVSALIYAGFTVYPLLSGPKLTASVTQREDGQFVVQGTARRVSSISINGFPVPLTDQGIFSVERAYPPGYTVVIVRAEDRFGRVREQTLTFSNNNYTYHGGEENSGEENSSESGSSEGVEGRQTSVD